MGPWILSEFSVLPTNPSQPVTAISPIDSQAGLDVWGVRANRTKMQGTALTALEPLVFPRVSTEIALVLAPAVDGMLSQPVTECG